MDMRTQLKIILITVAKKKFCHGIKIREDMIPFTVKEKFLSSISNKSALVPGISTKLSVLNINIICCKDDADTCERKSAIFPSR